MMKHICTYFDYNFLPRGLALYKSVKQFHDEYTFYVLCFDKQTHTCLSSIQDKYLVPISIETYNEYFNTNPDKFEDRKQFFFSATPNLCIYIFESFSNVESLLYLDADMYVFNSLDPIYEEVEDKSIGICSHRFHPLFDRLSKNYGRFNVGVNYFKRDEEGLKCLHDWKSDCDSWYPGMPGYPLNFFSDQIFLDKWPKKYNNLVVIENIGVDVAPWNIANYKFMEKNNTYFVNDKPLIIYHFSTLKKINENSWNGNTIFYFGSIKGTLLKIYKEYINKIESFELSNAKVSLLSHKNSILKRLFYFVMRIFLNETLKH